MDWFSDFSNFGAFTIAFLAIALIGGGLALIKKQHAKRIMLITGIAEAIALIAALISFATNSSISGGVFDDVSLGTGMFTALVIILLIAMLLVIVISGKKERWTARDIAIAAMCVAMSFILSCIKLFEMPMGGTITPASLLPMMVYIVAFGPARGLVVGCAYGLLQLFQGAYVIHPMQLLVDYPMAFGALALGGLVRYIPVPEQLSLGGKRTAINLALPVAVLMGYIGRYIMAVLSGVIFFAEYAGEEGAMLYSLSYNIFYLGPDCLVCMLVSLVPGFGRLIRSLRKR